MMTEYPFALEWQICEGRLRHLKEFTSNDFLSSDKFKISCTSGAKYFLRIYPNGRNDESRGETWIFLHVNLENEKKVEAKYAFSIKSANWNHKTKYVYEKSEGFGPNFCTRDELIDSNKKFITDGLLTVKVEGIFKLENVAESKTQLGQSITAPTFRHLWKIGYEDFTVVADEKEVQVHKCVLASHSSVFGAMFNTKFKEGSENRVEIVDFPSEIVQKAVELCYQQKNLSDFSTDELIWLLKFTDKYDFAMIKENIEEYLSEMVTVSNFVEMVKTAGEGNALKLQKKCLDFFTLSLSHKHFIQNVELLDNEFLVAAVKNSFCQKSQTF